MRHRNLRWTALVAILFLGASGCFLDGGELVSESQERVFAVDFGGTLELSNINGSISVEAADRNEIRLVATKQVRARSESAARKALESIEVAIDEKPGRIQVETKIPKWNDGGFSLGGGSRSVEYRIEVPAGLNLKLRTINGKVVLDGVTARAELKSTNGQLEVRRGVGLVDAQTINGSVKVTLAEVWDGSGMSLSSTNGSVRLSVPPGIQASVEARTVNGSVKTDFDLNRQSKNRKSLKGDLNGGGPLLKLKTVNGSVRLLSSAG